MHRFGHGVGLPARGGRPLAVSKPCSCVKGSRTQSTSRCARSRAARRWRDRRPPQAAARPGRHRPARSAPRGCPAPRRRRRPGGLRGTGEHRFRPFRRHVAAEAGDQDVLLPARHVQEALGIDLAEVAGREPCRLGTEMDLSALAGRMRLSPSAAIVDVLVGKRPADAPDRCAPGRFSVTTEPPPEAVTLEDRQAERAPRGSARATPFRRRPPRSVAARASGRTSAVRRDFAQHLRQQDQALAPDSRSRRSTSWRRKADEPCRPTCDGPAGSLRHRAAGRCRGRPRSPAGPTRAAWPGDARWPGRPGQCKRLRDLPLLRREIAMPLGVPVLPEVNVSFAQPAGNRARCATPRRQSAASRRRPVRAARARQKPEERHGGRASDLPRRSWAPDDQPSAGL